MRRFAPGETVLRAASLAGGRARYDFFTSSEQPVLTHLHIENLAVIEQLDLELDPGFTVFTGETGAGKSIVIDAIGLILGERADPSLIRAGRPRASVTAVFDLSAQAGALLAEQDLEASDHECTITRQLSADGRTRAFINGIAVPARTLQEIGEILIDIHGQHAHQSLLRREIQLAILDGFSGATAASAKTARAFREWQQINDELLRLQEAHELDREAERALLDYQIHEIEILGFTAPELPELEREHSRLANLSKIIEGCQHASQALREGHDNANALISRSVREIRAAAALDERLEPVVDLLDTAAIHVEEACATLNRYLGALDQDPRRLQDVEARIATLAEVARKHRILIAQLPAQLAELRARLAVIQGSEARLNELKEAQNTLRSAYQCAADGLRELRTQCAPRLARQIAATMRTLGMPRGEFVVRLDALEDAAASGQDRVEFQVTTNPGQPPRPLEKVASGGELSRISLAIQVLDATAKGVPTLIFDEVDAGIGGAVAEIVGRQLRQLAQHRQILCVTHLPQVASLGHHHYSITKHSGQKTTTVVVGKLHGQGRIQELARMLGGINISAQTLRHAEEMLTHGNEVEGVQ
ncbi:MAG: DNA repair protein RecN [Chromatiales bacterium]